MFWFRTKKPFEVGYAEGIRIVIPALHLSVREGNYMHYEPDEDIYTADFSVTSVYEENETDPAILLYLEQDGIQVSLYNFLRNSDQINTISELEALKCIIEYEIAEGE